MCIITTSGRRYKAFSKFIKEALQQFLLIFKNKRLYSKNKKSFQKLIRKPNKFYKIRGLITYNRHK